jgi:hypothetical protein
MAELTVVKYRQLSPNAASLLRCEYLMKNKMQCPTHASVQLLGVSPDSAQNVCVFHFNQLKAIDNDGINFVEASV